ncbi:MAG: hypothetical protein A2X94_03825 [Bdellovibrionales bacterium GWB1_55_8]|nr:MAG: hypothetical protein A2X94_03825 [Bdellovibrionales bacterium GWB1_55_8]
MTSEKRFLRLSAIVFGVAFTFGTYSSALANVPVKEPVATSMSGLTSSKRHKVIEFDDELVEGMNKRPLDSLSQISERERNGTRSHLYRKRAGFRQETQNTLKEMRYSL